MARRQRAVKQIQTQTVLKAVYASGRFAQPDSFYTVVQKYPNPSPADLQERVAACFGPRIPNRRPLATRAPIA